MFTALPPTLFCDDKLEKENASFVMVVGVQKQHENMVMNLPRYSQPNSNVMKKILFYYFRLMIHFFYPSTPIMGTVNLKYK